MSHRKIWSALIGVALLGVLACDSGKLPDTSKTQKQANAIVYNPRPEQPTAPPSRRGVAADPIVIPDCRITIVEKRDVPSQRDSVIKEVFVKENDMIKEGQLLAQLDDRLAKAEQAKSTGKIISAEADLIASKATRDEARQQYLIKDGLNKTKGAASSEEVRVAYLTWERYSQETIAKDKAVELAKLDKNQADIVVEMHQIKSPINGIIKNIFKHSGESVKNLDTVVQIQDLDTVRIEGLVGVEYQSQLKRGMPVVIEPSVQMGPRETLVGHLQEVNCVAVSKDPKTPLIVSGDEEGTVRVWHRQELHERLVYRHPAAVRAVACTGPLASTNLCLTGCADGKARLFDLDKNIETPILELTGAQHRGAITAVAFSPDGKWCVTGGEDRDIHMWDVEHGFIMYKFPQAHRGGITSLQFANEKSLVSAARDSTLIYWEVTDKEARPDQPIPRRSGEVTTLGVSPDGKHVLFDQGKNLRVLSLPRGATRAVLQNPSSATNFSTFALFSPNGQIVLSSGASDGRMQMWRLIDGERRGFEVRSLVSTEKSIPTCAAFAPDSSFLVTGSKDRQVIIWPVPNIKEDLDRRLKGEIVLLEKDVQTSGRQVRIWAKVLNASDLLVPGTTATLVVYPQQ